MTTSDWKSIAEQKRQSILALIPDEWRISNPPEIEDQVDVTSYLDQFLTKDEIEIISTTANQIALRIASGSWTAERVTRAFCHRAALAHQVLHCLHEIFFETALEDARKLDKHYQTHGKPIGPLHGVPISLKDQFHVRDIETTMGYVGWMGTYEGKKGTGKEKMVESEMVKMLRNAGAVLYCKTSVPHTLMSGETINNIIGYTLNPKNRRLTSGGSSGGEGALIGARGSPLGLGTDIGGSIRIPAVFNGLYGLRPSSGRLPYEGMANSMDGQNSILSVVGPLAPNPGSLKLIAKTILDQKPWLLDPLVHEIPWRAEKEDEGNQSKLCFGVMKADGIVNLHPPVLRAVEELARKLQDVGHEVIDWAAPSTKPILDAGFNSWIFDAGNDVKGAFALSGEPMSEQVKFFESLSKEFTGSEIAATNVKLRQLKKEYLDYWNSTSKLTSTGRPVDAIISPLAPFPAARPGRYTYYGYSSWVNALDYSTVTIPVTTVDEKIDEVNNDFVALNDLDAQIQSDYDPHIYAGAHVGVQIIGRRLEEEKILAIAEMIEPLVS